MPAGPVAWTRRAHASLAQGIARCGAIAEDPGRLARRDPDVSAWSVADHVEHLILAESGLLRWIARTLEGPDDEPAGGGPTRWGRLVLVTGRIPRGGRAPAPTVPGSGAGGDLSGRLEELGLLADGLAPRIPQIHRSRSTREHPMLGHFTPARWLRFLDVHHRHHEKIIRDIEGR